MALRLPCPVLAALAALAVSFLPASATADPQRPHPYFRDAGTLDWRTNLDEAAAAARSSGRLIFIEYGRKKCGNCKATVEAILPSSGIRARVSALCVGLAAECDTPDPRVDALFARWLPTASILPFCALVTADLRWVDGWAGLIGTADCLRRVAAAEPVCARWRAVAAAASPPCARGVKQPMAGPPPAPPKLHAQAARPLTAPAPLPSPALAAPIPPAPSRPAPLDSTRGPEVPAQIAPAAPRLSLDGPSDDHGGCAEEGEEGEMECKGGQCRLVRRPAAVPAPEAASPEPLATADSPEEPKAAPAGEPESAPAPASAPSVGLAIAPTAPRQTLSHTPTDADWAVAREVLARAVSAAGRESYGDVIRLHAEAARLPVIAEPGVWNDLHARAEAWVRSRVTATVVPTGPRPASAR